MWIILLHILIVLVCAVRILLAESMTPQSRLAWFIVILIFPFLGGFVYLLFGEIKAGEDLDKQHNEIVKMVKHLEGHPEFTAYGGQPENISKYIEPDYQKPFNYLSGMSDIYPVVHNTAELMPDGAASRSRLIEDIDAAKTEIHLLYYIWLDDETGINMAQAMMRAAKRGVKCRVMVDGLGSRAFLRSKHWQNMIDAGVDATVALSIKNPIKVILNSRIDLRNHRKLTIIDSRITYIGSQNCADEAFAVKAKYAPWVDIMVRFEGQAAAQNDILFASNWYASTGEVVLADKPSQPDNVLPAMVMGDGPTGERKTMPQLLVSLCSSAKESLTITTPYFIPDESTIDALCATSRRGVKVIMNFPKNNDSWIVGGASRSYYKRLLQSGVEIYEYRLGLLHSKILVVDDLITLIGSSNFDLRSFDLNFENNILLQDEKLSKEIRARQQSYIDDSDPVYLGEVKQWSYPKRMWTNLLATVGPLL